MMTLTMLSTHLMVSGLMPLLQNYLHPGIMDSCLFYLEANLSASTHHLCLQIFTPDIYQQTIIINIALLKHILYRHVKEMSPTSQPADTDYIDLGSAMTVTWKDVFRDSQAGITKFIFSLGTSITPFKVHSKPHISFHVNVVFYSITLIVMK